MNPQSAIAHYRITSKLGEGGMGEVWLATDTKLNREVAIKVLPESYAQNPDRMARFTREAQVLAALNHPNIAAIYGVEGRALIMELAPGPTLAERIAQGAIPIEEALPIARQIAEALEYAHERGIVHRDLKPANIKVSGPVSGTPEGKVKVLDFGLAKAVQVAQASAYEPAGASSSPTLTMHGTQPGVILGTAAYMSPEQAKGRPVDRRADIWSFGVVLAEMLTGRRMFSGETTSETLAAVLLKEPDLSGLPAGTPAGLRKLLRRCLDRDTNRRLQAIGEARIAIDEAMAGTPAEEAAAAPAARRNWLPWALAGVFACLALGLAAAWLRRPVEEARTLKLSVLPPEKASFTETSLPAVSPDGRHLVFAAGSEGQTQLWIRDLDTLVARPLPDTESASDPFWSPDSRFVAFFVLGKLKKVEIAGGPALTLCDAANGRGGSWNQNDVVIFTPGLRAPLFRVPAAGGMPAPLTALDGAAGESSHRFPWFLPDGRHFLFTARSGRQEKTAIYAGDLESSGRDAPNARRLLFAAASNVAYTPPGFLLFMREKALMAQPFDAAGLRTTGSPFPVAEQVDYVSGSIQGQFAVSETGVLAYYSGGAAVGSQLTWFDRAGKPLGTLGPPGFMLVPAISPDDSEVAVERLDVPLGTFDLWLHDVAHATDSRFTFDPRDDRYPVWSPGGSRILFGSNRTGKWGLYQKPATGAGKEELLYETAGVMFPTDWSRDGRLAIFDSLSPKTGLDLWVLPLSGDRKPFPFLETEFGERGGKLSPDGRWLAYESNEAGEFEVYVETFPGKEGKWQVSANGGTRPVWSRDGNELFYIAADNKLMAVDVKSGAKFEHGVPNALFEARTPTDARFDVTRDGKRFLLVNSVEQEANPRMTVVINWQAGVQR